jgi:hypothetical protein
MHFGILCEYFPFVSRRKTMLLNISSFVILKDGRNAGHLLQVMFVTDVKYLVCWWLVKS